MQVQRTLIKHALQKLFERVGGGPFEVSYTDGTTDRYGSGEPAFTIRLNADNLPDLIGGDLFMKFGEAYMDGKIDVEGDLADLISFALRSGLMTVIGTTPGFAGIAMRAAGKLRSHKRAKENIAHHYDLGNDFFRLWLDDSMTYSCAYFRNASDTLELAQQQKIEHSLRKLRLQPGETLLDIGCGWGSLVLRAAGHHGVRANGITLSEEQTAEAGAAIAAHGLNDRAEVRLMDYESVAAEGDQFDKIVSIGMIEHVGKEHLAHFTKAAYDLLKPGGLALLHLITAHEEGPVNQWVDKYIFPGGYIPTLAETITHLSAQGFRIWDVENLAPHYRLTLDQWSGRFERAVPGVTEKFGDRFTRMWRLYLRTSAAAFSEGVIEVHQILVSRGQPTDLPLSREGLYEGVTY